MFDTIAPGKLWKLWTFELRPLLVTKICGNPEVAKLLYLFNCNLIVKQTNVNPLGSYRCLSALKTSFQLMALHNSLLRLTFRVALWHILQLLTVFSISMFIPGHQMYWCARLFIWDIPGWVSWSSCITLSQSFQLEELYTILPPHSSLCTQLTLMLHKWLKFRR